MSRTKDFLLCPACRNPSLNEGENRLTCEKCGTSYAIVDGFPVMTVPEASPEATVKGNITAYYSEAAGGYELSHGIGHPGGDWGTANKYMPFFRRHLAGCGAILEIGSGTGRVTRHLEELAPVIIASDISLGMLRYARVKNGLATGVVADAENLPFRDAAFDGMIAMNALSYCVNKGKALAEAFRVLKPGGRIVLIDMNYLLHLPYHLLAIKEWRKARLWTPQLLQSTPWGWRKRFSSAGFKILEQFEFNWIPHRFSLESVRRMEPLDRLLSSLPLVRNCAMRIGLAALKPET